jgi:uncharacterized protein involved in tolerance to divalent cations
VDPQALAVLRQISVAQEAIRDQLAACVRDVERLRESIYRVRGVISYTPSYTVGQGYR